MNRNLWLMVAAQALFMTNNIVFVAVNGLVGLSIAPYTWLATLPIMGYGFVYKNWAILALGVTVLMFGMTAWIFEPQTAEGGH